jgi:ParB family transcriptional regulator, chromosome partitioning protein
MNKRKGLKGLESWIGSKRHEFSGSLMEEAAQEGKDKQKAHSSLPIAQLEPSKFQPREDFYQAELEELAESIREVGIIEPIVIRPSKNSKYEILAGERRWRAAKLAELKEIPVIIHEVDDKIAAIITLVENLQRQNLNPIEEAKGIQQLISQFSVTRQQAKKILGKSDSAISRILGLLQLAKEVQQLVREGKLSAGHAKVLIGLPIETQITLAKNSISKDWSVRELEKHKAQHALTKNEPATEDYPGWEEAFFQLQKQLRQAGGTIRVRQKKMDGKPPQGVLEIPFERVEDCYVFLDQLGLELKS